MPFVGVFGKHWFRPIESSSMIDINLASFFYMGTSIRRLSDIKAGQPVSAWAFVLTEAREGLKSFLHHAERARIFSKTSQWALSLLNTVNSMIPDAVPGTLVPNRILSEAEVKDLEATINTFAVLLSEESERLYVVSLQKQRAFDLHTLVEAIQTVFDGNVWDVLSFFSKREIKEAGRCLALERYTASGFHMLRAVECEVRDCAMLLSQEQPKKRDLGAYIDTLRNCKLDAKSVAVLDNIRSLERNPLMHPEDYLSQDEAINIFNISVVAFDRLLCGVAKISPFPPKV